MKKAKLTKIFVLILSLACLIGSTLTVFTSAEEAEAPAASYDYSIKSVNISHGDKIEVLIAVNAPIAEAADLVVKYDFLGKTDVEAKYWKNIDLYPEDGVDEKFPVFYTEGISPKDMGEILTAKTYKDGEIVSTDTISVAQYLYTRLYKNNVINASDEENIARKELYLNLLSFGAQAQKVLWNNKAENADNQRTLVTDYTYATAIDGTVNGRGALLAENAGEVTFAYTGSSADFVGWNITTYVDGKMYSEVVYKNTATADVSLGHVVATPCVDANFISFEGLADGLGYYAVGGEQGTDGWKTTTVVKDFLHNNLKCSDPSSATRLASIGAQNKVETLADGNKVLHLQANGQNGLDSSIKSNGRNIAVNVHPANVVENPTVTVVEMDMYFNAAGCSSAPFESGYMTAKGNYLMGTGTNASGGTTYGRLDMTISNGYLYLKDGVTGKTYQLGTVNTWFNYRFEYYSVENVVKIYVDGVCKHVFYSALPESDRNVLKYVGFSPASTTKVDAYFDNIYAVNTNLEYTDAVTFDDGYVVSGYTTSVHTNTQAYEKKFNDHLGNWVYTPVYDYGYGITSHYAPNAATYRCATHTRLLERDSGDTYLNLYATKRGYLGQTAGTIGTDDRTFQVNFQLNTGLAPANANAYIFEADMKIDSGVTLDNGTFVATGTGSTISHSFGTFTYNGGGWAVGGSTFIDADTWTKVRFVHVLNSGKIQVYTDRNGTFEYKFEFDGTIGKTISVVPSNSSANLSINYDNVYYAPVYIEPAAE